MSREIYEKPGLENDYLNSEGNDNTSKAVIYPIITVVNAIAIANVGAIVNAVGIAFTHVGVVGSSCKEA